MNTNNPFYGSKLRMVKLTGFRRSAIDSNSRRGYPLLWW